MSPIDYGALAAESGGVAADVTRTGPPDPGIKQPFPDWLAQAIQQAAPQIPRAINETLPSIGAGVGLMAGGPGGLLLGAGGGEAVRQLLARANNWGPVPQTAPDAMGSINSAMAMQGMFAPLAMRGASALPGMAERTMTSSVHPTPAMQRLYPKIGQTMLDEKMKAFPGMEGSKAAVRKVAGAEQDVTDLLQGLAPTTRISRDKIMARVNQWFGELSRSTTAPDEKVTAARKLIGDLEKSWPGAGGVKDAAGKLTPERYFTPEQTRTLMRKADQDAKKIFLAQSKGPTANPVMADLEEGFNVALRRGARDAISEVSPEFSAAQGRLGRLHGAESAITEAEMMRRSGAAPAGSRMYLGNLSVHGSLIPPQVKNRVALLMNEPWFQNFVRTSPQQAMALIQALGGMQSPGGGR